MVDRHEVDVDRSDLVGSLLGDAYRPGGLTLAHRLAFCLRLAPGERVLDLGAGRGVNALALAAEHGVVVDGVDRSTANVALAVGAADAAGVGDRVRFVPIGAAGLPFAASVFDAVFCQCLFPCELATVDELARVLRPGGRLGVTDVTAGAGWPAGRLTALARWTVDVEPVHGYVERLETAGLRVTHVEPHDEALAHMVDQIDVRLSLQRTIDRGTAVPDLDVDRAAAELAAVRDAVADGVLGYSLLVAEKS